MANLIDLSGKQIGAWSVLSRAENRKGYPFWNCRCSCGAEKTISGQSLRSEKSLSCGCVPRNKKCSISGCNRKHLANGLCNLHYLRYYRTGKIGNQKSRYEVKVSERIKTKLFIQKDTGCWIYTGKLTKKGYAHVRSDGGSMRFAHRILYEEANGSVPDGLELDHICRNRACCNPDHLEPVTHLENVRRSIAGHNWRKRTRNVHGQFVSTTREKEMV